MSTNKKTKSFLIISHSGSSHENRTPYPDSLDIKSILEAILAINNIGLKFDLVIGAPGTVSKTTASFLARGTKFVTIKSLGKQRRHIRNIMQFFQDLGLNPDPELVQEHQLIDEIDELGEMVGKEVSEIIREKNPSSALIITFPPVTQLLVIYLLSLDNGSMSGIRLLILGDRCPSCNGYIITVTSTEKNSNHYAGIKFPPLVMLEGN